MSDLSRRTREKMLQAVLAALPAAGDSPIKQREVFHRVGIGAEVSYRQFLRDLAARGDVEVIEGNPCLYRKRSKA